MHQRPQHRPFNAPRMARTKSRPILRHPHTRHPSVSAPRNRPIRPTPLHLFFRLIEAELTPHFECESEAPAFTPSTQSPKPNKQSPQTHTYPNSHFLLAAICYLFSLPLLHHHAKAGRRTGRAPRSSSRSVWARFRPIRHLRRSRKCMHPRPQRHRPASPRNPRHRGIRPAGGGNRKQLHWRRPARDVVNVELLHAPGRHARAASIVHAEVIVQRNGNRMLRPHSRRHHRPTNSGQSQQNKSLHPEAPPPKLSELCVSPAISALSFSLSCPKNKKPRQSAEASYTSLRCTVYHFFKYYQ